MKTSHAAPGFLTPHDSAPQRNSRLFATRLPRAAHLLILSLTPLLLLSAELRAQTPVKPGAGVSLSERPIELNVGGDAKHTYEFALEPGELFQVHVAQAGVDVLLRLLDAAGREVRRASSPRQYVSDMTLTFVAAERGIYKLEVGALDPAAAPGKGTIRRATPRAATARDRSLIEVEHVFADGMAAWAARNWSVAVQKIEEADAGWRELGDGPRADETRRLITKVRANDTYFEGRKLIRDNEPQTLLNKTREENLRKAMTKIEEARAGYHRLGEAGNEARALISIARAASLLGDEKLKTELLERSFPLWREAGEASVAVSLGVEVANYYLAVGDYRPALKHFLTVQPAYEQPGHLKDAASIATAVGGLYHKLGDDVKAAVQLEKALKLRKHFEKKCYELEMLSNLGLVYLNLGRKGDALKFLRDEAVPLYDAAGQCRDVLFAARNNLGKAYFDLGDYKLALESYDAAAKNVSDKGLQAIIDNNLGTVYYAMGEYQKALDQYQKALKLYQDDPRSLATTQTNVGVARAALGQEQTALAALEGALDLRRKVGDRNGEVITLTHLSEISLASGRGREALEHSNRALALAGAANDPNGSAVAFANAMKVALELGNRRLAIFYGKQSVNRFQALRGAARVVEGEIQRNYLRTVRAAYRQLAELLVEDGRLEQAIQVLNLYQDQQFFDFDTGTQGDVDRAYLSARESDLAGRYETAGQRVGSIESQIAELRGQQGQQEAGAAAATLRKLEAEFVDATDAVASLLKDAATELAQPAEEKGARIEEVAKLRKALGVTWGAPGKRAVFLYPLVGEEKFHVLLVTPSETKAFSRPIKAAVVSDRVEELLTVLSCPDFDPLRESAALYDVIFKSASAGRATLEAELEMLRPDLLLWSPGNPLDTVPMAALYDARRGQFLVERYQHAVSTRARPDFISRESESWIDGIGLGTSKAYTSFNALPGVRESLSVIFDDKVMGRKGIMNGPALIDEEFKRSALDGLGGKWPLVHIASHFAYSAGNSHDSALLVGDGSKYRLSEMRKHQTLFANVELLMLSACKTSVQRADDFGREIDGFAELAQRLGARSVIATLWNISEADVPGKEVEFYRLYRRNPGWAKTEVLRQSQLNLLHGKLQQRQPAQKNGQPPAGPGALREGCSHAADGKPRKRFTSNPKNPLAHPYYWAPFVLYGSPR